MSSADETTWALRRFADGCWYTDENLYDASAWSTAKKYRKLYASSEEAFLALRRSHVFWPRREAAVVRLTRKKPGPVGRTVGRTDQVNMGYAREEAAALRETIAGLRLDLAAAQHERDEARARRTQEASWRVGAGPKR